MNRREFMHPRRLADAVAPVLGIADELKAVPEEATPTDPVLLRFARRAMATTFEVVLPFDGGDASEGAQAALDEIDQLEAQLTVYRDTSEVSRLNTLASNQPVRVERNLFDLLTLAKRLHDDTEGAFDISIGALIKTWGFFRRQGRVPTADELAAARECIGMGHILLDEHRHTVFFERRGIEINLGSIGKGHALDRAAQVADFHGCLMHGGYSSILARGAARSDQDGWTVGLTDPREPLCRRALVHLRNRAMATSAITYQHFEHDGKKLGHLLDPRTAWPAEGVLSATVTAPSAAMADALATAFFILGAGKSRAYCEQHPEIGAVLISADAPHRLLLLGVATQETEILR
jgi:thiamine biosynthesis lipoprotein